MFCEEVFEDVLRLMSHVMAFGAQGDISFSHLLFFHRKKSFRLPAETVEDVKVDPEASKERHSHLFEIEDQALINTKSLGVCNRDLRRRELFHASLSEEPSIPREIV